MAAVNPIDVGGIAVAIIAAGSAWLSSRSADKASVTGHTISSRLDAEKEAYERARDFDLQTIQRQHNEIEELRERTDEQDEIISKQAAKIRELESKISVITLRFPNLLEGMLRERLEEPDTDFEQ